MDVLTAIKLDDLPDLRKLYEVDQQLHVMTTNVIGHFTQRFQKRPEWTKIVTFWSLNDNWRQTGTFVIINSHDDHIVFNTLELSPYSSLRKSLDLLNYSKPMAFLWFREIFRPTVLEVIHLQNLEITNERALKHTYMEYEDLNIEIHAPDGFYFDSLNQSHLEVIISGWYQKYAFRPREYVSNCIAQNPSTGLFEKNTGKLVAWTTLHETGASGNVVVDEKYRRQGFAELVVLVQNAKIKKAGYASCGHSIVDNYGMQQLLTNLGSKIVDNHVLITVRRKEPQSMVSQSLRGHL